MNAPTFVPASDLKAIVIVGPRLPPEKHSAIEVGPRPTPSSQIGMPLDDMADCGGQTAQVTNCEQTGGERPVFISRWVTTRSPVTANLHVKRSESVQGPTPSTDDKEMSTTPVRRHLGVNPKTAQCGEPVLAKAQDHQSNSAAQTLDNQILTLNSQPHLVRRG